MTWRLALVFAATLALTALLGALGARPWGFAVVFLAIAMAWAFTHRQVGLWAAPLALANAALAESLAARDASLATAAMEKDALVREIHHRVRNNLQVIASLVSMHQRTQVEPSAQAALSDMRDRIALIHRTLYQGPDLQRVEVNDFLADLIEEQVTDQDRPDARVRAILSSDRLMIDADRLAPLALFAVEAISNVRKHALINGHGELRVTFTVRGGEAELVIADEGGGGTPDLSYEGAGRVLMSGFARQLKGRLDVSANDGGGVTVRLVFPTDPLSIAEGPADRG